MQTKNFLLTLGLGMVAGGAVALMLPDQCKAKQAAQKAVDTMEQSIANTMK